MPSLGILCTCELNNVPNCLIVYLADDHQYKNNDNASKTKANKKESVGFQTKEWVEFEQAMFFENVFVLVVFENFLAENFF